MSARYAAASITRGFIGLDFHTDVGDLRAKHVAVEPRQQDYLAFYSEMKIGDLVLVQAHHYPFALVEIAGDYTYVPDARDSLGLWFCHLRLIKHVRFYADWVTNPQEWQKITMTDTISPLRKTDTISYQLIEKWAKAKNQL